MKPTLSSSLFAFALFAATAGAPAQSPTTPPAIAREFRGAWVATVDNIDFPSRPGLSAAELRTELDAIVARAAELKLNALVFQVRPAADAFYKSSLEPWSEWLTGAQGKAPDAGFDPLAYVVQRAHRDGIQLHAWFNPFRCWHKAAKGQPHASHVTQKAPELVVQHGDYQWMDPSEPLAQKWSLATVQEVLRNYDVDGVHIDDYFYPYPEGRQFADGANYAKYQKGGGKLGRAAWRRQHVDGYVQALHALIHKEKPWVAFGISPFGIARPGVPKGIQAGIDQYEELAADVGKWLREGWLDYLAPQLYWPIDQTPQSFPVLLDWWHAQNAQRRAIWPGLGTGRALAGGKLIRASELADEIALVRKAERESGHIHYSFKALRSDARQVGGALRDAIYKEPALVPAMAWLDGKKPLAPVVHVEAVGNGKQVRWEVAADAHFVAIQVRDARGWRTFKVCDSKLGKCALPAGTETALVTAVGRTGLTARP